MDGGWGGRIFRGLGRARHKQAIFFLYLLYLFFFHSIYKYIHILFFFFFAWRQRCMRDAGQSFSDFIFNMTDKRFIEKCVIFLKKKQHKVEQGQKISITVSILWYRNICTSQIYIRPKTNLPAQEDSTTWKNRRRKQNPWSLRCEHIWEDVLSRYKKKGGDRYQ